MDEIAISIIVPVYNTEAYLSICLDSIVKNEQIKKEIIIIDDGSTDNSPEIIKQYATSFQNIKVIYQQNMGNGTARNAGLRIAQGKYVTFIDSDDIIDSTVLTNMYNSAVEDNVDIVIADYYEFDEFSKKKIRRDKSYIPEVIIDDFHVKLMKLFYIQISFSIWNKIYKRSFLLQNDLFFIEGFLFEDLDFVFKSVYCAKRIKKHNEIYYGYRQRSGSIMKTVTTKILDKIFVADQIKEMLQVKGIFDQYYEDFKFMYYKMLISVLYVSMRIINKDRSENFEIVNQIFSNPFLCNHILIKFDRYDRLTNRERLIYSLMKYRIMNQYTCKLYVTLASVFF